MNFMQLIFVIIYCLLLSEPCVLHDMKSIIILVWKYHPGIVCLKIIIMHTFESRDSV